MRGRCVTGAYQRMGYTDMVATSPADYIARAINIANDRDARARACGAIAEASRVLFESQASVIELEDFLLHTHTASFTEGPLA